MPLKCHCTFPGHCPIRGIATTAKLLQVCKPFKPLPWDEPHENPAAQSGGPVTCRDCANRSGPAMAANGRQIGSEGCGCTSQSVATGILWWTCEARSLPVRETAAGSCADYVSTKK